MRLIDDETTQAILAHYPKNQQELIESQIHKIEELITENKDEYTSDKGFQKALDLILTRVIQGHFLQKETV